MRFFIILSVFACNLMYAAAESEPTGVTCKEAAELVARDMKALRPGVPDAVDGVLRLSYLAQDRKRDNYDMLPRCESAPPAHVDLLSMSIPIVQNNMRTLESCLKDCKGEKAPIWAQLKNMQNHISRMHRCMDQSRQAMEKAQQLYAAREAAAQAERGQDARVRAFIDQHRKS